VGDYLVVQDRDLHRDRLGGALDAAPGRLDRPPARSARCNPAALFDRDDVELVSTRSRAESTIMRMSSREGIPAAVQMMGRSECPGCSRARGLISRNCMRPEASARTSTRPPSRQPTPRHAASASASASSIRGPWTSSYFTSCSQRSLLTYV